MVVIIRPCVTHPFPLLWLSQLLILRHGCVVDSVSAIIEAHFDILAPLHSVCPLDTRSESKAAVYCLATVIVCLLPTDCALKVQNGADFQNGWTSVLIVVPFEGFIHLNAKDSSSTLITE